MFFHLINNQLTSFISLLLFEYPLLLLIAYNIQDKLISCASSMVTFYSRKVILIKIVLLVKEFTKELCKGHNYGVEKHSRMGYQKMDEELSNRCKLPKRPIQSLYTAAQVQTHCIYTIFLSILGSPLLLSESLCHC